MSEEFLATLCLVGILGGLALLCFVICKVMDFTYKRKERKHHKEHPEFFRLYDDYHEKGNIACQFYNNEIAPLKRKINCILREERYWPQEVLEQRKEGIEKLRREIHTAECMHKEFNKETQEARQKVADYVHAHNIKWAGDWD